MTAEQEKDAWSGQSSLKLFPKKEGLAVSMFTGPMSFTVGGPNLTRPTILAVDQRRPGKREAALGFGLVSVMLVQ